MNKEKIKLIAKTIELLVQQLNLELQENGQENILSLQDIIKSCPDSNFINEYEPDYYEEE